MLHNANNNACNSGSPPAPAQSKQYIYDLTFDELARVMSERFSLPRFRSKQLWHWVYKRGSKNFASMHNIPKEVQDNLESHFSLARPSLHREFIARDATRKWLFNLGSNHEFETVFIPEEQRGTLCISSQIGCSLTCKFCHTGTQTLVRNLSAGEIVAQVLAARDFLCDWPNLQSKVVTEAANSEAITKADNQEAIITNIVFMGMGEPFMNYDNVIKALNILQDVEGLNYSKHKITVSTSGIASAIRDFARDCDVPLALSLHSADVTVRTDIMPITKRYNIAELIAACQEYCRATSRKITLEYVMLAGVNDSLEQASQLTRLMANFACKVNLIPFNPWPGTVYKASAPQQIKQFAEFIRSKGYLVSVRKTRGEDQLAACGQLRSDSVRPKRALPL